MGHQCGKVPKDLLGSAEGDPTQRLPAEGGDPQDVLWHGGAGEVHHGMYCSHQGTV